MIGERYGNLTVTEIIIDDYYVWWKAKCDCGANIINRPSKIKTLNNCRVCKNIGGKRVLPEDIGRRLSLLRSKVRYDKLKKSS